MSQVLEYYRYAVPGERSIKRQQTGSRQQQVHYLPGLEVRCGITPQRLLVIAAGHGRIYREQNHALTHFNLSDRLGSVSGVVNAAGSLVSQEIGYPFGGTACWLTSAETGAAVKFQRYCGKERDATGLIFYGWRYYAPWRMRWLNSDPAGTVDGLNLFRMVGNNPLTLCDWDGRVGDQPLDLSQKSSRKRPGSEVLMDGHPSSRYPEPQLAVSPGTLALNPAAAPVASTSSDRATEMPVTSESPLTCKNCGKEYATSQAIREHYPEHIGEKIICPFQKCKKEYKQLGQLNKHIRLHAPVRDIACEWPGCSKSFISLSALKTQMQVHIPGEKHICDVNGCQRRFSRQNDLVKHQRKAHGISTEFKCDLCHKICKGKQSLANHKRSNHPFH